jgi:hypothetical protein
VATVFGYASAATPAPLATLVPIRTTLTAATARDRWQHLPAASGLDHRQVAAVLASPVPP